MRKYSRLVTIQEKRHRRQAIFWILLTILFSAAFLFWGLPNLARFSAFISEMRDGELVQKSDSLAPAPPIFTSLPAATNSARILISGTTEPNSTLIISHNGIEEELTVETKNLFEKEIMLLEGENTFIARARDSAGNESQNSKPFKIIYDATPPAIEIIQPQDGQTITGQDKKTITIRGQTNEETEISVNGRKATILSENKFLLQTNLAEGENIFTIVATDFAGNKTEKTLTIQFSP